MTLSDYLQSVSDCFTSNTAFHFFPGNYTYTSSKCSQYHGFLLLSNVHNLNTLFGHGGSATSIVLTDWVLLL